MTRCARLFALALLSASSAGAQLIRVPPVRTVATLGACVDASPKIVAVTDGATASDCATGAGVYDVTCYCANGAWAASATASGTVTTFSVVTANGVSASVANATTTPAATFTLGAITPTSVAASGTVTGSNLSGTNTGDQTNITGNAATATALQSTLGVAGGGTGVTSLTAYAPVCGGTTTTGAVQSCGTGIGTTGYVLTSNGAAALPSWQAAAGGGGVAGSDTQVTFNDAGTAAGDAGLTYDKTTDRLTVGSVSFGGGNVLRPNGSFLRSDTQMELAGGWYYGTTIGIDISDFPNVVRIESRDKVAWANTTDYTATKDLRIGRYAATVFEVDGGSSGAGAGLMVRPAATPPVTCSGAEGTMYFDSDTHKPCYCNGTNYVLFSDDTTACS
jgi:hypothetical protein